MDYDSIDREMSTWVVTCQRNGTRFYLSDGDGTPATDMLRNARQFRWEDIAESAAQRANDEAGFAFGWSPMRYAQALTRLRSLD